MRLIKFLSKRGFYAVNLIAECKKYTLANILVTQSGFTRPTE